MPDDRRPLTAPRRVKVIVSIVLFIRAIHLLIVIVVVEAVVPPVVVLVLGVGVRVVARIPDKTVLSSCAKTLNIVPTRSIRILISRIALVGRGAADTLLVMSVKEPFWSLPTSIIDRDDFREDVQG